jgi:hypothetical protein
MNIERLLAIKEAILKEPQRYNQTWFRIPDYSSCGTAHCIGGWAVALFGSPSDTFNSQSAQKILDLNREQAENLFFEDPAGFEKIWAEPDETFTLEDRAKLAAKRIDFFIKTNGTDVV